MTNKIQAIIMAHLVALFGFISWLVSLPPSSQDALIKPMIDLFPVEYRPVIGLVSRVLACLSTVQAYYKASQSGPKPTAPTATDDK